MSSSFIRLISLSLDLLPVVVVTERRATVTERLHIEVSFPLKLTVAQSLLWSDK